MNYSMSANGKRTDFFLKEKKKRYKFRLCSMKRGTELILFFKKRAEY